jgi:hypothetical protein
MNRREAAVELLTAYRWWIGSATVVAVGLAVWFGLPEIPEIPRGPRLFAVGALAAIALGYAPAMKIVEYLYSPEGTYLVDIDARDNGFALYHLSPEKWEHLEVETGELYRLKTSADAYACRQYWPDYDVCMGTWRGSASDLELLEERERIDEIRETLEQQAQEGLTMRMKVGSIVRTAVRDIVNDLVSQYEGTAIHGGERVETTKSASETNSAGLSIKTGTSSAPTRNPARTRTRASNRPRQMGVSRRDSHDRLAVEVRPLSGPLASRHPRTGATPRWPGRRP